MNPVAEALTGWPIKEALGKPLAEVLRSVTATAGENVETLTVLAMRERRILTLPEDAVLVPKSGNTRPLDDSVAPIQSHTGNVLGAVIVFRDATHRRRNEAALIQAERRYREIFENAVVGMFQSTPDGRYLKVNQALAVMHGYRSPQEMIEATTDIAHQEYPEPALRHEFRHLLEERNVVNASPLEVLRHDGARLSTIVNARVVCDAEGRVLYYEGTQEDITERRSLQAQFEHAQKMEAVGRLAGGIAHDFNNILNVISGYSDIAKEKVATNHPIVRDITQIKNAAARAARLTRQLLVFSRQQIVQPTVLDLVFQPLQLFWSERAHASSLQVHYVDESNEVHALLVKAVPASALCVLAVTLEVLLAVIFENVVLTGNEKHILSWRGLKNLVDGVELLRFGKMADVTGVQNKLRRHGQRIDFGDRGFQSRDHVGVRGLVESHVAIADLDKTFHALSRNVGTNHEVETETKKKGGVNRQV